MSDSDSETEETKKNFKSITEEINQYKSDPKTAGMFVSGWDDADVDVDLVKNPKGDPKNHILWAAENGELETVMELLRKDPTLIDVKDSDGYTPLHRAELVDYRAAYGNHIEVISYLLGQGADLTARTELGWTPLHSAANWNNYSAAALLIQAGADINAKTEGNQTPLHLASAISHCRSTLLLLLNHPDIIHDSVNASGETPLQLAAAKGQYAPLFHMVDPAVSFIKSREFTDNPFMRP